MADPIFVSLASVPRRIGTLRRTVESLLPQVDRLCVYLNGYSAVPDFLEHEKITVGRSQQTGDHGDAGKFWWSNKLPQPSYRLSVDDDLLYPPDYCATLVRKIDQLRLRAVVGVHGVVLPENVGGKYYGNRKVYPCLGNLAYDTAVHVLGTGALAYHTSTVTVRPSDFRRPNMADIWFGILAKRQKVPMICIAHARGWLVDLGDPQPDKCIANTHASHNGIQAAALRAVNPWPLPLTLAGIRVGQRKGTQSVGGKPVNLERKNTSSGRSFGGVKVDDRGGRSGAVVRAHGGVRIKR